MKKFQLFSVVVKFFLGFSVFSIIIACSSKSELSKDEKFAATTESQVKTMQSSLPNENKEAQPDSAWERIRRGFKIPELQTELIKDQEQWYSSRPDYIQRMTERSSRHMFYVVEELERRNMPTELALLPFIESAFNSQAVSSARAAGMWQFMPATGTDYDLKQNIFRDDRRDVLASTRAALDYLQRLYNKFGDWHLALAAYNWGEGSVDRAIAKNQRAGLPTGYTDLAMPAETRNYVPKLQAMKNIVADPQRFRVDLPVIPNHPYFQTLTISRDVDVALAAKLANMRIEDFRTLNPAAHKPVLLAAGTPQILLPWDNAAVFQRNFDAYTQGQYASWTAWTVPTTMTVTDAAQRSGMSEADLRAINNMPPRMLIKAGSTLIVPRNARVLEDVDALAAGTGHPSSQPEVVTRRTLVNAERNDSVASLARRFRVSAASVAEWNNVKPTFTFQHGHQVVMFLPVKKIDAKPIENSAGLLEHINEIPILFGTNRKISEIFTKQNKIFSSFRGAVQLGIIKVTIPPKHKVGEINIPSFWRLEFKESPEKHMILKDLSLLNTEDFSSAVDENYPDQKTAFIFVHGYNVNFEDAALRTAQMAADLGVKSIPMFFSWASAGTSQSYTIDENTALQSVPDLKYFLRFVSEKTKVNRIYLIAHSMGSRIATQAMAEIMSNDSSKKNKFSQVVLAAPDLDASVFKEQILPVFISNGLATTIYASNKDKALQMSTKMHGCCRAGAGGANILIADGVDSIDASEIDTDFLGHSYFADTRPLLTDIQLIFSLGTRPSDRPLLSPRPRLRPTHYYFKP